MPLDFNEETLLRALSGSILDRSSFNIALRIDLLQLDDPNVNIRIVRISDTEPFGQINKCTIFNKISTTNGVECPFIN